MSRKSVRFRNDGKSSEHELEQRSEQEAEQRAEQGAAQRAEHRAEQGAEQRAEQGAEHRAKHRAEQRAEQRPIESPPNEQPRRRRRWAFASCSPDCLKDRHNILAALTLLSMLLGLASGLLIRPLQPNKLTVMLIGYPGELLMRMLKMLILPLVVSSLVAGLSSLDVAYSGKIVVFTLVYCFMTTWAAVMLGILLVMSIQPGNSKVKNQINVQELESGRSNRTLDNVLDLLRNLFPSNIILTFFNQVETKFVTEEEKATLLNNPKILLSSDTTLSNQPGMNVLGLVCVSIIFGLILRRLGCKAHLMIDLFNLFNDVVMGMVRVVIWYCPVGIFSLIASKVLSMDDIVATFRGMGLFVITVSGGLIIHTCLIQALSYLVLTRTNPFTFFLGVFQAWITALGTASSAATLPITFRCLEENNGIDKRISRFVLPIGATVNMNGAALYLAVSGIFIAQINEVTVGAVGIIVVSLTATLAAIGTAGLPGGALVPMSIVVRALGLPAEDISLIMKVDWLLDLQCTAVNILGDALCAGILDHLCRIPVSLPNLQRSRRSRASVVLRQSYIPVDGWLRASMPVDEEADTDS